MYLVLKLLHVISVVVFLGNIGFGLFWKLHADRTRDPRIIAHAIDGVIRSDRLFTVPGVFAITAAGIATAIVADIPILGTGWILWSIVLFTISGIIFMARVAPLQRRLREAVSSNDVNWSAYHRLSRQWELWGGLALLTPVIALILMVLKPELPGL